MKKVCTKCLIERPLVSFNRGKAYKDGHKTLCKSCEKQYNKERYLRNKTRMLENSRDWAEKNKERKKEINLRSSRKNSAKRYEYLKFWRDLNKDRVRCHNSKYRAAKQKATPLWLTERQFKEISDVYTLARECEVLTGDKYHVDHIIPLNGENICGLHVPWNLQVLPYDMNIRKSNKAAFG